MYIASESGAPRCDGAEKSGVVTGREHGQFLVDFCR